ncbi:3-hydroxybenzoate 6-monooxygenase [Xenorhabdus bovienii]|uniref:3-hydroxybenzoate 6-hydroxylase n=1 Tax=Xenorhabdus bovienii str. Intermedium TaxID=1379677 RepID=A0A077QCA4_XENBV|nr:3-hydroxybenzoate 6-monooxygenase [Xenorhabdus bovienii]MDE9452820.1 3-hydroxybenzoate 6-monooxygenase [Xenorhabdus bovienii]MDE9543255.1 3-hydroxybenzoate 6-monooxygenase [Xenorhabdus bovienii]MDE9550324.1 3-hydroxybenzoate 6-monooxygenase [Xenorhabdus bovienii]CDH31059.1 3-hydroxybenzoate 6-hydroxylase [Xenorhabdus bovienii str. Intermedium]
MSKTQSAIIVGGGIGGAAAALSLAKVGIKVLLLEQANEIGEIGAGIQLGPNAFSALDSLGIGEIARERAVFTDYIAMMDAMDANEVVRVDTGQVFRDYFGGPYAVIHRADIHDTVWQAALKNSLVSYRTATKVVEVNITQNDAEVIDEKGNSYKADVLIGCDGGKSIIRDSTLNDKPRVTGHVVYRAVIEREDMPEDLRINAPVLWGGPHCHLVHYPLRGGSQYNLVVTFHSRQQEEWGVTDGSKEEVMSYFDTIHPRPRQMLDKPTSWRRWATADREPVESWGTGRVTLLGDAAHPVAQYMAQGACMALEDAVTLGEAVKACNGNAIEAFKLYQAVRIPRTARIVWSTREMGRLYHAKGVEREVRNLLWKGKTQQDYYKALEWLYGWKEENCLQPR